MECFTKRAKLQSISQMTSLGVVDPRGMGQARNGHLEPRTRGRSPWGGHECAFWGVPGRFALAHSMPGLCLSTPHVYSTYMACADQLMDAGRCMAPGSGKRAGAAHRRRRAGEQRSQEPIRHMDCQRAALWPAGSPHDRRNDNLAAHDADDRHECPHRQEMARPRRARAAGSRAVVSI